MKVAAAKSAALERIAPEIAECRVCRGGKIGLPVPGEGNPDAEVVFIGEAPGKTEATTGRPFVGRAGSVLRSFVKDVGLKDKDIFITSPVKYLPIAGTPTPAEVAHGRMHLSKQLEVIQPTIIVLLGRIACLALLQKKVTVSKEHGTVFERDGRMYFITYHPAALLHASKVAEPMKNDFKKLKMLLRRRQNNDEKIAR